ncbi:MAG: HNH endonuclease signature motif containing protein [Nostocoides sp.]
MSPGGSQVLRTLQAREVFASLVGASSAPASGVDASMWSVDEWVGLVDECQQLINTVSAIQTYAVARAAATEDVPLEDGTVGQEMRRLGYQRLDAPSLVAGVLGVSEQAAVTRVDRAIMLATDASPVLDVMAAGRLDGFRASVVCDELSQASPEVVQVASEALAPSLGRESAGPLRRRVRRLVCRIDEASLKQRAEQAAAKRSLRRYTDYLGVDQWVADLPLESSRAAWAAVDSLAHDLMDQAEDRAKTLDSDHSRDTAEAAATPHGDDAAAVAAGGATPLPVGGYQRIEQARADALIQLILGKAIGHYDVQLAVPAEDVKDLLDRLGDGAEDHGTPRIRGSLLSGFLSPTSSQGKPELRGSPLRGSSSRTVESSQAALPSRMVQVREFGVTQPSFVDAKHLAAMLTAPEPSSASAPATTTTVSVLPCDSDTGAIKATETLGTDAYRPTKALIDLVKARDGRCRFPGCTINARYCDLDHVRPWPAGPTRADNLVCLCRRHHRIKQRHGWALRLSPDATLTVTSPTGVMRTSAPVDFLGATDDVPIAVERAPLVVSRSEAAVVEGGVTRAAAEPGRNLKPSMTRDVTEPDRNLDLAVPTVPDGACRRFSIFEDVLHERLCRRQRAREEAAAQARQRHLAERMAVQLDEPPPF